MRSGTKTPLQAGIAGQQRRHVDRPGTAYHRGRRHLQRQAVHGKVANPSTSQNPEVNSAQWTPVGDASTTPTWSRRRRRRLPQRRSTARRRRDRGTWSRRDDLRSRTTSSRLGGRYYSAKAAASTGVTPGDRPHRVDESPLGDARDERTGSALRDRPKAQTARSTPPRRPRRPRTALGSNPPPLGTSARSTARVIAGGSIRVLGQDNLERLRPRRQRSRAASSASAPRSWSSTSTAAPTPAPPRTRVLTAGSGATDEVRVEATTLRATAAIAFGGAIGVVTVGGQVVVLNDHAAARPRTSTTARTSTRAGGGVRSSRRRPRRVSTLAIGVGARPRRGGRGDRRSPTPTATRARRSATSRLGATGTVRGRSTSTRRADVAPDGHGVLRAGRHRRRPQRRRGDREPRRARRARRPARTARSAPAASTSSPPACTAASKAETFNAASGAIAAGLTIASANDARHTEAALTSTARISTSGAVKVVADATNVATANAPGGTLGLAGITIMLPTATVAGHTHGDARRRDHGLGERAGPRGGREPRARRRRHPPGRDRRPLAAPTPRPRSRAARTSRRSSARAASIASSGHVQVNADLKGANVRNEAIATDRDASGSACSASA